MADRSQTTGLAEFLLPARRNLLSGIMFFFSLSVLPPTTQRSFLLFPSLMMDFVCKAEQNYFGFSVLFYRRGGGGNFRQDLCLCVLLCLVWEALIWPVASGQVR